MDEDLIALCVMVALLVFFPFSVVVLILGLVSYSRTKAWDKARAKKVANLESSTLLSDDDDSDFYDTDEEADRTERKAEEQRDAFLTFGQKWRKEFVKCWKGKGAAQLLKEREREERKKLAKAVARELERRERRKARKAEREIKENEGLPPYKN
ncbi:hypothetical protein N0V90_010876 [Kalmusia sp. IMI 367209]|nr:hypothetical protein N0V90_010876 [Kalmusia sp. IMI 367209]